MGVAMSGMFVPAWAFGPNVMWELVFAGFLVWFVVRTVQSVQAWGLHVPHTAIHAVMSFGMLLMYWFPLGAPSGAMAMTASATSGRMDPGLALLITFVCSGRPFSPSPRPTRAPRTSALTAGQDDRHGS